MAKAAKKAPKKRADKYEEKVAIKGSFEDVINISINRKNMSKWKKIETQDDVQFIKVNTPVLKYEGQSPPPDNITSGGTNIFTTSKIDAETDEIELNIQQIVDAISIGRLDIHPFKKLISKMMEEGIWFYDMTFAPPKRKSNF